jgi:hypothetical protein
MTMLTALSDEGRAHRRNMHHTASDSAPLSVYFLIANARLEFSLSQSKDSLLKIPNRERIAIFHLYSRALARKGRRAGMRPPKVQGRGPRHANGVPLGCPEEDRRRRRVTEFLIEAIENQKISQVVGNTAESKILIGTRTAFPEITAGKSQSRRQDALRASGRAGATWEDLESRGAARVASYELRVMVEYAGVRVTHTWLAGGAVRGNSLE